MNEGEGNAYDRKYDFAGVVNGYAEGLEDLDLRIVAVITC